MSVTVQGPETKSLLWGMEDYVALDLFGGRFLYDTLAWERIGWLILKLGHLTCMIPKDEKAKPLWCQVGLVYIAKEFLSVLGWLDKGCDLERLPGLAWHLVLGTVLGSASGHCFNSLRVLGQASMEAWRGGMNGRKRDREEERGDGE